jgi:8-oxo-dGTP pyrophosphatase MutT (NUDIX family)
MSNLKPATDISTVNLCPDCQWTRTNYKLYDFKKDLPYVKHSGPPRKRAGVFMYNHAEDKILVIQVFSHYIGIPKGGQEDGETLAQTAIRELEEEAGVKIHSLDEASFVNINSCTYYFIETDTCLPTQLHDFHGNDVSGVGWVHPECIHNIPGRTTSHLDKMVNYIRQRYPKVIRDTPSKPSVKRLENTDLTGRKKLVLEKRTL